MDRSWTPDPDSGITLRRIEANGLTFEVAEAGAGDHLALCLHGFPELNFSWRYQMPLLATMGYRVWAPTSAATVPPRVRQASIATPWIGWWPTSPRCSMPAGRGR